MPVEFYLYFGVLTHWVKLYLIIDRMKYETKRKNFHLTLMIGIAGNVTKLEKSSPVTTARVCFTRNVPILAR